MKAFGVGCVYFGYKSETDRLDDSIEISSYTDQLRQSLESLENVSNFSIEGINEALLSSVNIFQRNGQYIIVPNLGYTSISFDVFLPFRVQNEFDAIGDVENIHVDLLFGFESPIAIFSYEWPDEEGDAKPSASVVAIRKFLNKKITGKLVCDCQGPSPFHANFLIYNNDSATYPVIEENLLQDNGYADIQITSRPQDSVADVVRRSKLLNVFSKFYELSVLRSEAIRSQIAIVNHSRGLLEPGESQGFRNKAKALKKQSLAVDNLNREVFRDSLLRIEISRALLDGERSSLLGEGEILDKFFVEYRAISREESWSKFLEVARFFEDRRQKVLANLFSIFVGVGSGVIGALIGSISTYFLTK